MMAITDWHSFFFYLFALVTCVFGLAVLFSSHIVHMAFYLIISLGASAGLFILAGAEFVGAMQLLIYVGGTLVLLIFGVMLTAQERFISMRTRGGEWVTAAIVGGALLMLLVMAAFSVEDWTTPRVDASEVAFAEAETTAQLGLALLGVRVDQPAPGATAADTGRSGYLLLFEIASVHLLVVLIGAAYLARTKRFAPGNASSLAASGAPAAGLRREASRRRRGWLVSFWAVVGLVATLVGFGYMVVALTRAEAGQFVLADRDVPWWYVWSQLGLLAAFAVCLLALLGWQRWGYYALWPIALAMVAVNGYVIGGPCALGTGVAAAVYLGVLYFLLKAGRARSMWAQLE